MANELQDEKDWAKHMPSEGEDPRHAMRQSSTQGVQETVRSPEYQQAAGAAPSQADPDAAEANKEFVKDTAMKYNDAEEQFADKNKGT